MKSGSFSIVLNNNEYGNFGYKCDSNNNALMKILDLNNNNHKGEVDIFIKKYNLINFDNNLFDHIPKIYTDILKIENSCEILEYIKNNIDTDYNFDTMMESDNINYYFIENCGDIDIHDLINKLYGGFTNIFSDNSELKLFIFIKSMLKGLFYLKESKLSHFDIKPENIMYNRNLNKPLKYRFKIIDFGFCDIYPFKKFRKRGLVGTTFFIPYFFPKKKYPEWASKSICTDFVNVECKIVHVCDFLIYPYDLIYKFDIFSMGVTFSELYYYIKLYHLNMYEDFKINKNLKNLIKKMTKGNIKKRYTIEKCLKHKYITKKNRFIFC